MRSESLARLRSAPHLFFRWFCGRVLPSLPYPVLCGPLRGNRFILGAAAGEGGGASVYVNGIEPEQTEALLAVLEPGHVMFDVGANVGYYTLLAARKVGRAGRVLALEPFPRNISFLYRHLALNGVENVDVLPVACSDSAGLSGFSEGVNCATGRLSDRPSQTLGEGHRLVVTVTIDEVVRKSGLRPDVVKIDVEGAEERVLRGAENTLSRAHPVVLLSVHSDELRRSCTAYLATLGYLGRQLSGAAQGEAEILFAPPRLPDLMHSRPQEDRL